MRRIGRELAGWLLVILGLLMALICYVRLVRSESLGGLLAAGALGIVALAVLLGGSLLLGSLSLELAGWLLLAGGGGCLVRCYLLIEDSRLFQAAPLMIVGIIIFRGGIHLLKVAVAARICVLAKERTDQEGAGKPAVRKPLVRGPGATTAAARGS